MTSVGVVAVSHSPALAEAAIALALEMTATGAPAVIAAAGTADGEIGTDAARIAEAIAEADSGDGVAVIMDLGSAVMSAELALEFVDPNLAERTRLVAAPFVEGLLAAVVRAAGGASLAEVAEEATGALRPKTDHLQSPTPDQDAAGAASAADEPPAPSDASSATATVRNVAGLHARPAAVIAGAVASFDAEVTLLRDDHAQRPPVSAASPIGIATLAAGPGTVVLIRATGPQAAEAVEHVRALIDEGFGEEPAEGQAPTGAAAPAPARVDPTPTGPIGVSSGRVVGPAVVLRRTVREPSASDRVPEDARDGAVSLLREASIRVAERYRERAASVTGQRRTVLEATADMATDPTLVGGVEALIRDGGLTPTRAAWQVSAELAEQYRAAGGLIAERATDLLDVRNRLIAELRGEEPPGVPDRREPFILVADDLAPADTVALDPAVCLALITEQGGPTSHTAIIARELGLPAVVGYPEATSIADGDLLLVDGDTGEVVVRPDPAAQATATGVITLPPFEGPGQTRDGHRVLLGANVGAPRDVARAVERGAEGVGLFRTEFCFLDRDTEPSIDEQVGAYREVFDGFAGQRVVVRTLDAGSDKPLPFLTNDDEPNPALGVRGLRTARRHPDVLERQVQAIARAAEGATADVWVMAPMVATAAEARDFVTLARGAGLATVGVMIETPAAGLTAVEVMREVDFVSLGTNDLAQYTMAADRQSGDLADLANPWQPALLRLIGMIGEASRDTSGTPVGVCGEAAADPDLACVLVGLGVTSLSMAARAITRVGARLGDVELVACRRAAEAAVSAADPAEAKAAARAALG
ncbi:phosphotransferase system enzyme I (PtsI) [Microcella alkaliphila]|uniref:Phosphocarrier protein HPr n=1 Tax=Microcella alkaliphila TaxID=279828 RepID=A0A4Q7TGU6_9MICO|nr:phosphoenolpyruvate--protein phosphotransferase [Microcella alkaliphila]RZT58342.1 phosphotransferase system enzyme I (PtsI) [Microcella alkaliphila]